MRAGVGVSVARVGVMGVVRGSTSEGRVRPVRTPEGGELRTANLAPSCLRTLRTRTIGHHPEFSMMENKFYAGAATKVTCSLLLLLYRFGLFAALT